MAFAAEWLYTFCESSSEAGVAHTMSYSIGDGWLVSVKPLHCDAILNEL